MDNPDPCNPYRRTDHESAHLSGCGRHRRWWTTSRPERSASERVAQHQ